MSNKPIVFILVLGALGLGYSLSTGPESETASVTDLEQGTAVAAHAPQEEEGGARIPGAAHIHAVAYDHAGNLLLGTHGGLFRSHDGGKAWERVQARGAVASDDWMNLVNDPRDRQVFFAGGHDLGVIKSEDGGATWVRADSGIRGTDIHGLVINQRNPDILFAYSVGNGVFKSTDRGASWKRMDDGPENPGVRSFAYMAVETGMDKNMGWDNWGILFAGTADGIYQSFSCFCGWTKTTGVFDNTTVYALATLHENLRTMYAGTKDGIWKTTDEGKKWTKVHGLNDAPIIAIAINPAKASEVVAVTEEGAVYRSENGGISWQEVN